MCAGTFIVSLLGLEIIKQSRWWRPMLLISFLFVLGQFLPILLLAPESPVWLVTRGLMDRAHSSLVRLRGISCSVSDELQSMIVRASCEWLFPRIV